jgi:hypothetical protein
VMRGPGSCAGWARTAPTGDPRDVEAT